MHPGLSGFGFELGEAVIEGTIPMAWAKNIDHWEGFTRGFSYYVLYK
jgi:hypothetical protein